MDESQPVGKEQWHEMDRWERSELGRSLRRHGLSYGEIMNLIPVSKGTLAHWCRDIRLRPDQIEAIKRRTAGPRDVPRDTQRKRRAEVARLQARATREVPVLLNQPLWVAGVCLYWAEGGKTTRRLEVSNSDARLLRLFIAWVRTYVDPGAEFVLMLHLHEGNDELAAQAWWREALDLPDASFHKTFIKPRGTGHRKNSLTQGVCRVRVRRSTDAFLRTMAWISALGKALTTRYP